jgi:hypothetical protein
MTKTTISLQDSTANRLRLMFPPKITNNDKLMKLMNNWVESGNSECWYDSLIDNKVTSEQQASETQDDEQTSDKRGCEYVEHEQRVKRDVSIQHESKK